MKKDGEFMVRDCGALQHDGFAMVDGGLATHDGAVESGGFSATDGGPATHDGAVEFGKSAADGGPATHDRFAELIRAADEPVILAEGFEQRVMLAVARRAIEQSKRRARRALIALLSGLAMLLGASVALLASASSLLPVVGKPFDTLAGWFADLHISLQAGLSLGGVLGTISFWEQWGDMFILTLLAGGAVGFIYYLNSLFSDHR
ncbi:MAG: hypothetical protein LBV38_04885 [Alistipes sp.]|jgi:hypothetical protein|nr:hypothetical protein [Alistipes sp.]